MKSSKLLKKLNKLIGLDRRADKEEIKKLRSVLRPLKKNRQNSPIGWNRQRMRMLVVRSSKNWRSSSCREKRAWPCIVKSRMPGIYDTPPERLD